MQSRLSIGRVLLSVASVCLLVCATGAQARELRNSLETQAFGHWAAPDAFNTGDLKSANGWGGGFTIGYHFLDWIGLEFDYSHTRHDVRRPFNPAELSLGALAFQCVTGCSTDADVFGIYAMFSIPAGEYVSPFIKIGPGGFTSSNKLVDSSGVTFAVGAGARFFPIPDSGLNLRTEVDLAGLFPTSTDTVGTVNPLDESSANVRITFGLSYVWGFGR